MGERYEIRGKLGRGGMSTVYRAYDTVMGREVALKRLLDLEDTNLNESAKGALEREAAALAKFQHPNVVTIFALEEDADGPFVAMELIEGKDLNEVIKKAALSVKNFIDVAEQCLEALASAGELNLLHRDIKPANIMLTMTASGRFLVKILDFGLAKFSQQPSTQTLDHQGSFLGSIDYIAPEQLELKPLDQRTDLYSLGCVFYWGLTQKSAFEGGNPAETSMNHINHRCTLIQEIRPDLPAHIAAWVMRLISRRPHDRPSDAQDAMQQFQDALNGIPYAEDANSGDPESGGVIDSGPVAPPEQNVEPQAPQTGRRGTIPTGPTRTIQTGPTRTIQTGPRRTIPAGAIEGTSSSARGASRAVTGSTRSVRGSAGRRGAATSSENKTFPVKLIAAGVLLVLLTLFLLTWGKGRRDGARSSEAVRAVNPLEEKASGFPEPSSTELAYPDSLTLPKGNPLPPDLPVREGLVGRFVSDEGTFGRDYRTIASNGSRIAAWSNLAKPEPLSSLLRDNTDKQGNLLPLARFYTPESLPGLKRARRGVLLTNLSSIETRSRDFDFSEGFTFVAAMAMEMGADRFIRFTREPWDKRVIVMGTNHAGAVFASARRGPGTPWQGTDLGWWDREPGLIAYVCDVVNGKHQLFKIDKNGKEAASELAAFEGDFSGLNKFAIGRRQFDAGFENPNGHAMFEFAVFDRVLTAPEIRKVQRHLFNRYFTAHSN